jgi:hypothetical protein
MRGRKPQFKPIVNIIIYSYAINCEKRALTYVTYYDISGTFIRIFNNKNDFSRTAILLHSP